MRCASGDERGNLIIWELSTPVLGYRYYSFKEHQVFKSYENQLGGAIKDIAWTNDN